MTKRGTPPQKVDKRGTLFFVDREVFDVHVVVGINPTAQHDVFAATVYYSSYSPPLYQNSQMPNGLYKSTILSEKPNE